MRNKIWFALVAWLFLVVSCKEKIELDFPDQTPLLVIEGEVSTETDSSFVRLSLSSNYYSESNGEGIQNADVLVNGIPCVYSLTRGDFRLPVGFVGKVDSTYSLQVNYQGKTYAAQTHITPLFRIDSLFQTWKKEEGFLKEGYSISYAGFDDRPLTRYTYFLSGFVDTVSLQDSFSNAKILFDNALTPQGVPFVFEIPFTRFNSGDVFLAIFRSVDKPMYDFLMAYNMQQSGAPGPFQVPPANLPTNITGGGLGYFAGFDIKRFRYTVR